MKIVDVVPRVQERIPWPHKVAVVGVLLGMILGIIFCCGCTRTAELEALTVATKAATAAAPALIKAIQADEAKCLTPGVTYDVAKACVDKSRAHWAPALAGYDALAVADQAALDGTVDFASVLAAYCALHAALPALPPPPAVLGGCS